MSIILRNLSEDEADTYSLVLSTAGISHKPRRDRDGWNILVKGADDGTALNAIEKFIDENQIQQNRLEPPYYGEYKKTLTGIWISMILLLFHAVVAIENKRAFFIKVYGASAFGAIGMLSTYQFVKKFWAQGQRLKVLVPFG